MDEIVARLTRFFAELGFGGHARLASTVALVALILVAAYLTKVVTRRILLRLIHSLVERTRTDWDDELVRHGFFNRLSHLAPALVIHFAVPLMFEGYPTLQALAYRAVLVYMVLVAAAAADAFLGAGVGILGRLETTRDKPVKSYVQVVKILLYVFVGVVVVATLVGRSPWGFLGGLGALTAVLLLVFKDSILGFVASIQIAAYDIVRRGDWIEMPKYGADGDVIDISLSTIKVRNWDKTITSIPTYALTAESFKNWRGMKESGGRRIKRAVHLDLTSVKFVDAEMLARFKQIQYIKEYLAAKEREIVSWNREQQVDEASLVNGRRLTNVGTFRAYVEAYLRHHPMIHQDMTFLVRHLQPGPHGLPIEIYVFSREQRWAQYESLMADIFDHVLAVVPEFDLRVFQQPTGADFQGLREEHPARRGAIRGA